MSSALRKTVGRPHHRGRSSRTAMSPLGAIGRGLVAGAAGTLAMDALWFARYRRAGGDSDFAEWEFSSGVCSWEQAPAPAQVGKRLVEGLFKRELRRRGRHL